MAGQVWRFYYYAGGTRVAMREATSGGETLYYLLGDHLGSSAITADSSGNKVAELRYKAWGERRYTYGTTPPIPPDNLSLNLPTRDTSTLRYVTIIGII